MTLSGLIERFRRIVGDKKGPFLWSNEAVTDFLNDAVKEACIRKDLLFEPGTDDSLSKIAMIDDVKSYDIDPSFYKVIGAMYFQNATATPISIEIVGWSDVSQEDYYSLQVGATPKFCIVDDGSITILPPPRGNEATLVISGYRTPTDSEEMDCDELDESKPAISQNHHNMLVHWAVSVAMSDVDLDSYAPDVAQKHLDLFEDYFGKRLSVRRQQKNAQELSRRNKIWP